MAAQSSGKYLSFVHLIPRWPGSILYYIAISCWTYVSFEISGHCPEMWEDTFPPAVSVPRWQSLRVLDLDCKRAPRQMIQGGLGDSYTYVCACVCWGGGQSQTLSHVSVCPDKQLRWGIKAQFVKNWGFLRRGSQAAVSLRNKPSACRGIVTWVCPQLRVPRTHVRPRVQMKGFSVVTLKELRVQELPCFGTGWWSFPREGREGEGRILLLPASASGSCSQGPSLAAQGSRAFLLWWWRWYMVRVAVSWALGCLVTAKASAEK